MSYHSPRSLYGPLWGADGPPHLRSYPARSRLRARAPVGLRATAGWSIRRRRYARFQTERHVNFVMEYCAGGELFELLMSQPNKRFTEAHMRFYAAEVLLALQYLHLLG